jgi:hypothetical protein
MTEPEILYKNKPSWEDKLPYYRLTTYMDEMFSEPELLHWYDWLNDKGVPCCVAMGCEHGCFGKLAVWVLGKEYNSLDVLCNAEKMGRKIMSTTNWPEEI